MFPALRIVANMGSLHRLAPFWLSAVIALIVWYSSWLLLAILYGFFAQFFVEYVLHRFMYHRDPPKDQNTFNTLYRTHIGHHEFPGDPEYFTGDDHWFAVRFGLTSVLIHTLILWPIFGFGTAFLTAWVALWFGSVTAFAFYEFCHTLAHLNVPKGRFGKKITHEHLRHHFNDHESNFHVSFGMGWIDGLFGTTYDRKTAQDRFDPKTILSMGMDPDDLRLVTARKAFGISRMPRMRRESDA